MKVVFSFAKWELGEGDALTSGQRNGIMQENHDGNEGLNMLLNAWMLVVRLCVTLLLVIWKPHAESHAQPSYA